MNECVKAFNIMKKQMDKKEFDYNKRQLWENEIEKSINNFSFEKFMNDFFKILENKDQSM